MGRREGGAAMSVRVVTLWCMGNSMGRLWCCWITFRYYLVERNKKTFFALLNTLFFPSVSCSLFLSKAREALTGLYWWGDNSVALHSWNDEEVQCKQNTFLVGLGQGRIREGFLSANGKHWKDIPSVSSSFIQWLLTIVINNCTSKNPFPLAESQHSATCYEGFVMISKILLHLLVSCIFSHTRGLLVL